MKVLTGQPFDSYKAVLRLSNDILQFQSLGNIRFLISAFHVYYLTYSGLFEFFTKTSTKTLQGFKVLRFSQVPFL